MGRITRVVGTAAVALAAATSGAGAQVAWDAPLLLAPGSPGGWGIHLMDPSPGDGLGVMGTYRAAPAPVGYGFRLGIAEDPLDDLAVFGGVDVSGTLLVPTDDRPFGVLWITGVGLGIGDDLLISAPLGISVGADIQADDLLLRPYVSPRLHLDVDFRGDEELDLGIAADLGVDLAFTRAWVIRFGATVGDREALSIGLGFPAR